MTLKNKKKYVSLTWFLIHYCYLSLYSWEKVGLPLNNLKLIGRILWNTKSGALWGASLSYAGASLMGKIRKSQTWVAVIIRSRRWWTSARRASPRRTGWRSGDTWRCTAAPERGRPHLNPSTSPKTSEKKISFELNFCTLISSLHNTARAQF